MILYTLGVVSGNIRHKLNRVKIFFVFKHIPTYAMFV